ncbi:hypothetical protein IKA15_05535 [bacterium]|nr:hypothetical protein [bacterium]
MLKKLFVVLVIFLLLSPAWAWGEKKYRVVMDNKPITNDSMKNPKYHFNAGNRVYFGVIAKKKFKDDVLQYQVLHQSDKVHLGGITIVYSKRDALEYEDFYTDYFIPRGPGKYFLQVFELHNLKTPITGADFRCY